MTFDDLAKKTIEWGQNKGIISNEESQVYAQASKMEEEFEEFLSSIDGYFLLGEDREQMVNELGDVYVTAIITGTCLGITPEEALGKAYEKISKRTGKVVKGVFVKDSE